jgi:ketosteroid isomerase-like protein
MSESSVSADRARARANEPEDLARLLLERLNVADVEGVVELYEFDAVLALPDGGRAEGHEQLRRFYAELLAPRPSFTPGQQLPALRLGELALTATRLPGGGVTAEVARQQPDGSWRWALDRPNVVP